MRKLISLILLAKVSSFAMATEKLDQKICLIRKKSTGSYNLGPSKHILDCNDGRNIETIRNNPWNFFSKRSERQLEQIIKNESLTYKVKLHIGENIFGESLGVYSNKPLDHLHFMYIFETTSPKDLTRNNFTTYERTNLGLHNKSEYYYLDKKDFLHKVSLDGYKLIIQRNHPFQKYWKFYLLVK